MHVWQIEAIGDSASRGIKDRFCCCFAIAYAYSAKKHTSLNSRHRNVSKIQQGLAFFEVGGGPFNRGNLLKDGIRRESG